MWKITTTSKVDGSGEFFGNDKETLALVTMGIMEHNEGSITIEYVGKGD